MLLRSCLAAGAAGAALCTFAAPASAQSSCGSRYAVEYGDTLYQIAQQCRTSLNQIMDLNPRLDPRALNVGEVIRLEPRADRDAEPDPRQTGGQYRVRRGDTPYTIAERVGVSLFELLAANTDIDADALPVGEILDIPGRRNRQAGFSISPRQGGPDTEVTLQAYNLRPGDWVTIGAGPQASEWRAIDQAQVNEDGELTATVETPDYADPGDNFIFVIDTDRGLTLKSDVFDVTGRTGDDPGPLYEFTGRVREGAECYTLQAENGAEYALTSDDVSFTAGEYVRVEGRRAGYSYCQDGRFTLDVGLIEEASPPRDDDWDDDERRWRGDREVALEGRVRRGVECWTLTTPDGDLYAMTSDDVRFTEGEYVEITGETVDVSFCQQGEATIDVETIAEPRR
ncbi:MAG: DUF5818 domain-containing protein [Oceanicaulis sp.]